MRMTHLLHLDSSAATDLSVSRMLGRELVLKWAGRDPSTVITYRDLNAEPLPDVVNVSATTAGPDLDAARAALRQCMERQFTAA